jgi:hypothetical protein
LNKLVEAHQAYSSQYQAIKPTKFVGQPSFPHDLPVRSAVLRFMHPNGQLPAYEWNFNDVNPPVHVGTLVESSPARIVFENPKETALKPMTVRKMRLFLNSFPRFQD